MFKDSDEVSLLVICPVLDNAREAYYDARDAYYAARDAHRDASTDTYRNAALDARDAADRRLLAADVAYRAEVVKL